MHFILTKATINHGFRFSIRRGTCSVSSHHYILHDVSKYEIRQCMNERNGRAIYIVFPCFDILCVVVVCEYSLGQSSASSCGEHYTLSTFRIVLPLKVTAA